MFQTYKEGVLSEQGVTSLAELAVMKALSSMDTRNMTADQLNQMIAQALEGETGDDSTLLQLDDSQPQPSDKTMESQGLSWQN